MVVFKAKRVPHSLKISEIILPIRTIPRNLFKSKVTTQNLVFPIEVTFLTLLRPHAPLASEGLRKDCEVSLAVTSLILLAATARTRIIAADL